MHTSTLSSDIQQFRAIKDRVKYYFNLKRMLAEKQADLQPSEAQTPFHPKKNLLLKGAAQLVKTIYHATPEWVYANPLTSWGYKIFSNVFDKMIVSLKSRIKPNFVLFDEPIPMCFDFVKHETPLVSIIIPVHNKYHYTHKCLYSILKHTENIAYQIIIGDDASTDETATIQDRIGNIEVSKHNPGLGFLRNCNHSSKLSLGKYILMLNNDTVVQPGWLDALVQTIESKTDIGMVGSKLVYPEGFLQEAGGIIFSDGNGWNYGRMAFPDGPEYNYVKEVDYISGASIMLHKWLWDQLNGFDDRYAPAYYEDSDLAFEVRKAGFKVVYQPQSVVVHFEGISHGTDTSGGIKEYQAINKKRFYEKWKSVLEAEQCTNEKQLFVARDRSAKRKTILVIDHYVPEFDQDAGSKSTFQYIKLFTELGLNVKFLGDNFLKKEPYTTVLQQMGVEVLFGYEYESGWQQWVAEQADHLQYVFINRPHIAEKYIGYIKQHTKARIIFYGHDLHFLREERQYEVEHNKKLLRSAKRWKQKEFEICKLADVVLYPSAVEIQTLLQVMPSLNAKVLPLNCYPNNTGSALQKYPDTKHNLLFVGGFNHKPNADAVSWFASDILPLIVKQIPDIGFTVVGSNVPTEILALANKNIHIKGYVSDEELARLYDETRIVIAPLRFGAGVKGKVIEAVYYRNPVVTTAIGAEGLDTSSGEILVASTAETFAKEVIELYNNKPLLTSIFNKAPEYIHKHFSSTGLKRFVTENLIN